MSYWEVSPDFFRYLKICWKQMDLLKHYVIDVQRGLETVIFGQEMKEKCTRMNIQFA